MKHLWLYTLPSKVHPLPWALRNTIISPHPDKKWLAVWHPEAQSIPLACSIFLAGELVDKFIYFVSLWFVAVKNSIIKSGWTFFGADSSIVALEPSCAFFCCNTGSNFFTIFVSILFLASFYSIFGIWVACFYGILGCLIKGEIVFKKGYYNTGVFF